MMRRMDRVETLKKQLRDICEKWEEKNFDQEKTAGVIISLLERAARTIKGDIQPGRWEWVEQSYTSPEKMLEQAEDLLRRLKQGELPLKGKFAEIGGTVIDHALIQKDGLHHLFYIRGKGSTTWAESPTDNFGHGVSRDLINWQVEPPVLQGETGAWDGYQVWAPHVIYHDDEYWMFYTGVNENAAQAIGIARSKDLYRWERHPGNPVIKPGVWGQWSEATWSDCRDPMVLKDGDRFYAYYCSTCRHPGSGELCFCVGIASSQNLADWQDEGCIPLEKSLRTPPESPFAVKKDGRYYLFYTDYQAGTVYATSDDPVSGWKDAPEDKRVVVPGVTASEIYESDGRWYITCISHLENQFHFLEVKELLWLEDGGFAVRELTEA